MRVCQFRHFGQEYKYRGFCHVVQRQIVPAQRNVRSVRTHTDLRLERTNTMGSYRLLATSNRRLDRIVDTDEVLDMGEEAGADEDLTTTSLGLQALRHIDHIAHHRIFHALLGANIAHDGFATVDTNTQVQRGLTTAAAHRIERGGSTLDVQGCLDGALPMVLLLQGCPKEGEETITEEFIEGALVLEQHVHHELKVLVEDIDDLFRLMPLSKGRKVAYIREEHRHLTARTV